MNALWFRVAFFSSMVGSSVAHWSLASTDLPHATKASLTPGGSHVSLTIPIEAVVFEADKVARIKLIGPSNRRAAAGHVCPNTYRAIVIRSFKGGDEPFDLFIPAEEDFRGMDVVYLAIVRKAKAYSDEHRRMLDDLFSPTERSLVLDCRMSDILYVPGLYRSIWALDARLTQVMGQEWLEPDTRPAITWCAFEGEPPAPVYLRDGVNIGGLIYDAVSLKGAESMILRALHNPPLLPDGSFNEAFVPANCD
jgi:hypothetical protein